MAKKEGRIIASGINPQGVPWKEISFIEEKEKIKENGSKKDDKTKELKEK